MGGPPPTTREEVMEQAVKNTRAVGSPIYPLNEDEIRARAGMAYDRSFDRLGMVRQAVAVLATGDRTARLRSIKTPTLVIHGDSDRMCDLSGGRATAKAIKGAQLVVIEGMGHNLPRQLWPRIASLIADFVRGVEAGTI